MMKVHPNETPPQKRHGLLPPLEEIQSMAKSQGVPFSPGGRHSSGTYSGNGVSDEEVGNQPQELKEVRWSQTQVGILDPFELDVKNPMHMFARQPVFEKWTAEDADHQLRTVGELKIFTLTWNLHGKKGPQHLENLLLKGVKHHIYVISTQECMRSIGASMFFESKREWENKLKAYFGQGYFLAKSKTLGAIHMVIFVDIKLKGKLENIDTVVIRTGMNNTMGNKGAVAISFSLGCTVFLFINCHLASGQSSLKKRNDSIARIERELKLAIARNYYGKNDTLTDYFDVVFWMGDFNYRIGVQNSMTTCMRQDRAQRPQVLKVKDQLFVERFRRRVLDKYEEGNIMFAPTYKFVTRSRGQYAKNRIPGWTDRIFCKIKTVPYFAQVSYDSNNNYLLSDHRPVFAQFKVAFEPNGVGLRNQYKKPKSKACAIF